MKGSRFVGLVVLVLLTAGCALLTRPAVRIEDGVSPRMTADQVSDTVIPLLRQMEQTAGRAARPPRIVTMTATTAAGVAQLEPNSGQGVPQAPGVVWLVRAEGTFANNRTPPGAEPMEATSGFFVISDADGSVLGFGFP